MRQCSTFMRVLLCALRVTTRYIPARCIPRTVHSRTVHPRSVRPQNPRMLIDSRAHIHNTIISHPCPATLIMSWSELSYGKDFPNAVNVVIENPANAPPIKFEIDKASGAMFIDRFLSTSMHFPHNYGYVAGGLLSEDGDPPDVLVIAPHALPVRSVVTCRVIGMLRMTDEKGGDPKLIAVPIRALTSAYNHVTEYTDVLDENECAKIEHFFNNYKALEPNKWVQTDGFVGHWEALTELVMSRVRYLGSCSNDKPPDDASDKKLITEALQVGAWDRFSCSDSECDYSSASSGAFLRHAHEILVSLGNAWPQVISVEPASLEIRDAETGHIIAFTDAVELVAGLPPHTVGLSDDRIIVIETATHLALRRHREKAPDSPPCFEKLLLKRRGVATGDMGHSSRLAAGVDSDDDAAADGSWITATAT